MFKRQCMITLPTDILAMEIVSMTNSYCDERGLVERLDLLTAARVVKCAIDDVLHASSAFVVNRDTAEDLLKKSLPWYETDNHGSDYYLNVFDELFVTTEQLVLQMVERGEYDVWDVRLLRSLATRIAYVGDYRILEWERANGKLGESSGDVYVGDEECPRIYGRLIAMGYYRHLGTYQNDLAMRTLTNPKHIKDTIIDYYGNVVISTDDLTKGLRVE